MVYYAAFNNISVMSRRQLTLFMSFLGFTSTRLGSEVSCPRTLQRKTQRIQCGSNPGPLDYEKNTLPLSHAGPLILLRRDRYNSSPIYGKEWQTIITSLFNNDFKGIFSFQGHSNEKRRGSSAARTQDPWITKKTLYH